MRLNCFREVIFKNSSRCHLRRMFPNNVPILQFPEGKSCLTHNYRYRLELAARVDRYLLQL